MAPTSPVTPAVLLRFRIEIPKGGRLKRGALGEIEFLSPFACPYNYGSVPGTRGEDGDPEDVLVLGPRLKCGAEGEAKVWGQVRFTDAGVADPKWICGDRPPSSADILKLERFFRRYELAKRALHLGRAPWSSTRFDGLDLHDPQARLSPNPDPPGG